MSNKVPPQTGLPYLDNWNSNLVESDTGLSSEDPFPPYEGTWILVQNWTVGRGAFPVWTGGITQGQTGLGARPILALIRLKRTSIGKLFKDNTLTKALGLSALRLMASNYHPIRLRQIDLSVDAEGVPVLKQNPGYN